MPHTLTRKDIEGFSPAAKRALAEQLPLDEAITLGLVDAPMPETLPPLPTRAVYPLITPIINSMTARGLRQRHEASSAFARALAPEPEAAYLPWREALFAAGCIAAFLLVIFI